MGGGEGRERAGGADLPWQGEKGSVCLSLRERGRERGGRGERGKEGQTFHSKGGKGVSLFVIEREREGGGRGERGKEGQTFHGKGKRGQSVCQ